MDSDVEEDFEQDSGDEDEELQARRAATAAGNLIPFAQARGGDYAELRRAPATGVRTDGDEQNDDAPIQRSRPRDLIDVDARGDNVEPGFQPLVLGTGLASDDPISQEHMTTAIRWRWSANETIDYEERFTSTKVTDTPLDEVEKEYTRGALGSLLARIQRPTRYHIPPSWKMAVDDRNLYLASDDGFLDFILLVPKRAGCELISSAGLEFGHQFEMFLHDRGAQMRNKKGPATFDPNGNALRIGKHKHMSAWIVWVHKDTFERDEPDPDAASIEIGNTCMEKMRYRVLCSFLASIFDAIGVESVNCRIPYPDISSMNAFNRDTNILLSTAKLAQLDSRLRKFPDYIRDAPPLWGAPAELKDMLPTVVLMQYGQNVPINIKHGPDNVAAREAQAESFSQVTHWPGVKYVHVAIAAHLAGWRVREWRAVPEHIIINEHGEDFFSHHSCHEDFKVALADVALRDADGTPIDLWDSEGQKITRERPKRPLQRPEEEVSFLLDLKQALNRLQAPTDNPYAALGWEEPPDPEPVTVYPYALGFLQHSGNVQFKGISSAAAAFLAQLNRDILLDRQGPALIAAQPGVTEEDLVIPADVITPVWGVDTQIYHTFAHTTRESVTLDNSTRGIVTSAFTGSYHVRKRPDYDKWQKCVETIGEDNLPLRYVAAQLKKSTAPKQLRHETVYTINMKSLGQPSGKWLWLNVIVELAKILNDGGVTSEMEDCVQVFAPGKMPMGLVVGMAPWSCALEVLWSIVRDQWRQPGGKEYVVDPFLCNVAASLERALAFGRTGNRKVIVRSVMDILWVSLGIMKTGCPAMDPQMCLIDLIRGFVMLRPDLWPREPKSLRLSSAVRAAIIYTYGERVSNHFDAKAMIVGARYATVSQELLAKTRHEDNLAQITLIVQLVVSVYRMSVVDELKSIIGAEVGEGPHRARSLEGIRVAALEKWASLPRPLAYDNSRSNNVSYLLTALQQVDAAPLTDIPSSPHQGSAEPKVFSRQLLASILSPAGQRPIAKVVHPRGLFPLILKAAYAEIVLLETRNRPDKLSFFVELFERELGASGIHVVPGPSGPNTTTISPRAWTHLLSQGRAPPGKIADDELSAPQVAKRKVDQNVQDKSDKNPNSEWSIAKLGWRAFSVALIKRVPPVEWDSYKLTPSGKVIDPDSPDSIGQADWPVHAHNFLDMEKPLHRFGVWAAIGYFLQHPLILTKSDLSGSSIPDFQTKLFRTKWHPITDRGAVNANTQHQTNPAMYVLLIASYFIAIYDNKHPVGKRFHERETNTTTETPKFPTNFGAKYNNLSIRLQDLAHMNLLQASGTRIYKSAVFNNGFSRTPRSALNAKFERWQRVVKADPREGAMEVLSEMFGDKCAVDIMRKYDVRDGFLTGEEPPEKQPRLE